jgi:enoyl-CoA hydratase
VARRPTSPGSSTPWPQGTEYEHLQLERHADLAVVRIDRPPANALDPTLLVEGRRCVEELLAAEVGGVVLTGREGFFSAGIDLKVAPTLDAAGQREMMTGVNRLFAEWYRFPRPVVCAINGHAIAGGLILALCADYRVGTRAGGRFGLTELRAGIPYPEVAMTVVRAELGPVATRRLVLRAGLVGPPEALELGALDEVVDGDPVPRALEVAGELAALPRRTYERIKHQLRREAIDSIAEAVAADAHAPSTGWLGEETARASATVLGSG